MTSALSGLLAQTGGVWAKFPTPGTTYAGTIAAAPEVRQRTEFGTNKPLTWDDGSPQQEIVVTLTTDQCDASVENDDGTRKITIKAWGPQMRELKRAVSAAGDTDLRVGGTFSITYSQDGEPTKPGFPAPKLYVMDYQAPSATSGLLSGGGQEQAAGQGNPWGAPPAQQDAPAPAQSAPAQAAPQQADDPVEKAKQLISLGIDDATIHGTTGVDLAVIAALRNAA